MDDPPLPPLPDSLQKSSLRRGRQKRQRRWITVGIVAAGVFAVLGICYAVSPMLFRRTVIELLLPCGLVWIGLTCWIAGCWIQGRHGLTAWGVACWLAYTALGHGTLAELAIRGLEAKYFQVQPLAAGPYSVIVVLGGGTVEGADGTAHLNQSGDRIRLAAQLFAAGRTERVLVTGERIEEISGQFSDPGEHALELLTNMGVPRDRIEIIGGRTTWEEMGLLAERYGTDATIGVVTSAWHMDRALRYAEARGVHAEPLPADFRSVPQLRWSLPYFVPDAEAAQKLSVAAKEYFALWLGP